MKYFVTREVGDDEFAVDTVEAANPEDAMDTVRRTPGPGLVGGDGQLCCYTLRHSGQYPRFELVGADPAVTG